MHTIGNLGYYIIYIASKPFIVRLKH